MGNLYIVATPIGNLNDMTQRAIETLKNVSYILCEDTRTSLKLLNYFDINKKLVSYHKFNEENRVHSVINDLKNGKDIALISDAGTPCISDPGYVLVKRAREENIPVFGVGGISALTTSVSVSGLPSFNFTFYGFFPREKKEQNKLIKEISAYVNTFIFYESPKRIIKTLELLKSNFPNLKVSVSKELTKLHENNYYGNIFDVLDKMSKDEKINSGEYTVVAYKEDIKSEESADISVEALLVEEIVKNSVTLKEAVDILNKKYDNLSKKEIYNASLKLKDMF